MAGLGDLEVKIGADISGLTTGLNKATTSVTKFGNETNKLSTKLTQTKAGTNSAAFALQNFGRIAQDAPFGIIGITNNINPLLESFQRLKAETGSTGSAFKALAGSLLGAGGLGLAISLVTSALTFFAMSSRGATEEVEKINPRIKEAEDKQKAFNEAIQQAAGSLVNQADKLRDLRAILITTTASIEDITQATINQGVAEFLLAQKGEGLKKVLEGRIQQNLKLRKIQAPLANVPEFSPSSKDPLVNQIKAGALAIQEANVLGKDLEGLFVSIFDKGKKGAKETTKEIETVNSVVRELGAELDALNQIEFALGVNLDAKKLGAITGTIEKLIRDFKVPNSDTIIQKLLGNDRSDLFGNALFNMIQNVNSLKLRGELKKTLEIAANKTGPLQITVPVVPEIDIPPATFQKLEIDLTEGTSAVIKSFAVDMGVLLGESLGSALSGQGFGNFFQGIFGRLGAGLKELGKYFMSTAAQVIAFKKLIGTNPALAFGVGVALTALGSLIKTKTSIPGFANGVNNFRGGLAVVGERGPELINLPRGSDVIPNHALNSIGGRSSQEIIVYGSISGDQIYLSNQRAAQRRGRQG